jgi:maltose-binding protein MalE
MIMLGTWNLQVMKTSNMVPQIQAAGVANPKTFTAIPIDFPDVAGLGNKPILYGDSDYGLSLNKKSKNLAAAKTFALWLGTSKAGQQTIADTLNDIAVLNGVKAKPTGLVDSSVQSPVIDQVIAQAQASTEPRQLATGAMNDAINAAATSVATGQATPEQAAATLEAAWKKLINK